MAVTPSIKVYDAATQTWTFVASGGGGTGSGGSGDMNIEHVDPDVVGSPLLLVRDDGSIVGVPATATRPLPPTGITTLVTMSYVRLTWTASAGAATYYVYRDGVLLSTTGATSYRDSTIAVGVPYTYTLRAANSYGMRGDVSAPISAQANAADNKPPTIHISTWPLTNQPGRKQIIRVAATDVDAQVLVTALNASAGSLEATPDPSVWLLTV